MGQALYRKYRSRSLDEVVGQEHITTTLKNALKSGRISHAYLFTGPRGVGKTSVARILAYEINGLPYSDDSQQHLDIIEIDAASNRRIDEIRELRDKVHVAPSSAKYKVYIIDEVHMLTKEAFNALLKTLEEPPAHVVFILATTEAHKLPETIVSRTQRFSFRPIDTAQAVEHLKQLAKAEGIKIDQASLELIAEHGNGSFRDSISLLDQLSSLGASINVEQIHKSTGVPPGSAVAQLWTDIQAGQAGSLLSNLQQLYDQGYQAPHIAQQLGKLINTDGHHTPETLALLKGLIDVPASHDPKAYLELVLLEQVIAHTPPVSQTAEETDPSATTLSTIQPAPEKESTASGHQSPDLWSRTLEELKGRHNTLYGIARMAEATKKGNTITLTFNFPFHQRRCNEARNRERIDAILKEISGNPKLAIECVVGRANTPPLASEKKHKPKQNTKSATLDSVTEVFGGGEILE